MRILIIEDDLSDYKVIHTALILNKIKYSNIIPYLYNRSEINFGEIYGDIKDDFHYFRAFYNNLSNDNIDSKIKDFFNTINIKEFNKILIDIVLKDKDTFGIFFYNEIVKQGFNIDDIIIISTTNEQTAKRQFNNANAKPFKHFVYKTNTERIFIEKLLNKLNINEK